MVEFGLGGRRWAIEEVPEEAWVFMEPEEFMSFRFRRAARELNTLLALFYDHGEMPEFLRQLRRVVEDRPPEDPPPAAVLSRLPDDGPPSSGSCTPLRDPKEPKRRPWRQKVRQLMSRKAVLFVRSATDEPSAAAPVRAQEQAGREYARRNGLRIARTWVVNRRGRRS